MTYDDKEIDRRLGGLKNLARGQAVPDAPELRKMAERRHAARRTHLRVGAAIAAIVAAGVGTGVGLSSASSPAQSRSTVRSAHSGGTTPTTTTPTTTTPTTTTPTTTTPPTTTPATPTTTTTTTPPPVVTPSITSSLNAYVAGQAGASATSSTHSAAVVDGTAIVAVAAFAAPSTGHLIEVLAYGAGGWKLEAGLSDTGSSLQPLTTRAVTEATLAGVGPAFIVPLTAATNVPGVVVAETASTGGWQEVAHSSEPGYPLASDVIFSKTAHFTGNAVVTSEDNCVPDCASGHTTEIRWTYDPSQGTFVATATGSGG